MFEVIYETKDFNDPALWPTDGSQPFVYSFGDQTGYANHGDYVFGWRGDALQKIMDEECFVDCKSMRMQSFAQMNACTTTKKVDEDTGETNCESRLWSVMLLSVLMRCRACFAAWSASCGLSHSWVGSFMVGRDVGVLCNARLLLLPSACRFISSLDILVEPDPCLHICAILTPAEPHK
jgi:hypothetical protein